jgi:hypothetical protein
VGDWICLVADRRRASRENQARFEISGLFGADFEDMRMAWECSGPDDDVYCLVRCSNYHLHVGRLSSSPLVKRVLESYDNPVFLSDAEVSEFCESMSKGETVDFRFGDEVKVLSGYLSGLSGVVTGRTARGCRVFFRLHTRSFSEELPEEGLKLVGNVFAHLKFPVTTDSLSYDELQFIRRMMGEVAFGEYRATRDDVDKVRREMR